MTVHDRGGLAATNGAPIPAWVALAEIVARISREVYHWPVRRKTFDLIVHFATASGLPTGLRYVRGDRGPSFPGSGRLRARLLREGLLREVKEGSTVVIYPGPRHEEASRDHTQDIDRWAEITNRVADLFLRLEPRMATVAATVHFAAMGLSHEGREKPTEIDVLEEVKRWKQRRRPPLKDAEVASAIRSLNILGWLKARPSLDLPVPKEALLDT